MKAKFTLILLFSFLFFSCSSDDDKASTDKASTLDCSAVTCEVLGVQINLIDKTDGTNYIDKNKLESADLIVSSNDNSIINSSDFGIFKNRENESLIFIPYLDTLSITIKNEKKVSVSISLKESESVTNACCSGKIIENAQSASHESTYNLELNTLTIML